MAPRSIPVPFRSYEREFDSSCNFCFLPFHAPEIRLAGGSPATNIILLRVSRSRVSNGIRSWWDHVQESVLFCLPASSYGEFSHKVIIYQTENSTSPALCVQ